MNGIDRAIIEALNHFARESYTFDSAVVLLGHYQLAKGGLFMGLMWWAWFRGGAHERSTREMVLVTVVAAVAAVLLTRGLAQVLPFRDRPLHTAGFNFTYPYTLEDDILDNWSAFPSDHAGLFVALVVGLFMISRPVGIAAGLYAAFFVLLPRLYLGLHWPSDILVGGIIGGGLTWLAMMPRPRELITKPALWVLDLQPGVFYAAAFLVTAQMSMLFDEPRELLSFLHDTAQRLL